jgi:hypothetical protein
MPVSYSCAFCVDKFIRPCTLCPMWSEELLSPEELTPELIAAREKWANPDRYPVPLSH